MKANSRDKTLTFLHFFFNFHFFFFKFLKELFLVTRSPSTVVQTGVVSDGGRSDKNNSVTATHGVHVTRNLFFMYSLAEAFRMLPP